MIDQHYLRERLHYDPETGAFTWLDHQDFPANWRSTYIGEPAGGVNDQGYVNIRFNGRKEKAHRLAWVYVHGSLYDEAWIDHINGNRSDNRIANLRLADSSQNGCNRRCHKNNKSGVKNVVAHSSGKWQVQIKFQKQTYFFGTFETIEQAAAVADRERARLHGEFARAA